MVSEYVWKLDRASPGTTTNCTLGYLLTIVESVIRVHSGRLRSYEWSVFSLHLYVLYTTSVELQ